MQLQSDKLKKKKKFAIKLLKYRKSNWKHKTGKNICIYIF